VQTNFSQEQLQPQEILERHLVKKGNTATSQLKVNWLGLPDTSSTWEDWNVLVSKFPVITSWGQDASGAEESVTPMPVSRQD
jgi:hypothetical protein